MKIAVTGATGFVGRMIIPMLEAEGHDVIVYGRDEARLALAFPDNERRNYEDLSHSLQGTDAVLHLAVLNNNAKASFVEFVEVNVAQSLAMAEAAIAADVPKFINVSSIHALPFGARGNYAASKKEAASKLRALQGIELVNLYLPSVTGASWAGRLGILNRLPKPLSNRLFKLLSALKPTVKVARIAAFVDGFAKGNPGTESGEVILSENMGENGSYNFTKWLMDFVAVIIVAAVFSWLLIPVAIAIKWDSAGPVLFRQRRIGKGGAVFTCYKLRTMRQGTAERGTHEISQQAITRVGAWLRRYKVDEIPQMLNILRGEMTLVGPRPCLPSQTELISEREKRGVLDMLPGITGYAQVQNIDMSDPARLARVDQTYGKIRSILLDLKIILATAKGSGKGDRVANIAES